MVKVDLQGARSFFDPASPDFAAAAEAHRRLFGKSGECTEHAGWLELPRRMAEGELKPILAAAQKIRRMGSVLIVVGVGGSCLGAKSAIRFLRVPGVPDEMRILYLGGTLSPDAVNDVIARLNGRDFCVNVVSKSGTTLETVLGFRIAKALLEEKYGHAGAKKRIFVTTDPEDGPLHDFALQEGYELFPIPKDVGGRFSAFSAAGLLPMAVAGIDVEALVRCAAREMLDLEQRSPENPAWQYAAARQMLYRQGRSTEILACYEPAFRSLGEWWKQLFGESEGKNGIGLFPACLEYNADLHSMGQFLQEGPRTVLETVVRFETPLSACPVPFEMGNPDGLNYLAGRDLGEVQRIAANAVRDAHISGGVPNIVLTVPKRDVAGLAALLCFFEVSCVISALMSGVNPFDQPGVDAYKQEMTRMLQEKE